MNYEIAYPLPKWLRFLPTQYEKKGVNCFRTILKLLKQLIDENFIAT